jgi:hypothetical protein
MNEQKLECTLIDMNIGLNGPKGTTGRARWAYPGIALREKETYQLSKCVRSRVTETSLAAGARVNVLYARYVTASGEGDEDTVVLRVLVARENTAKFIKAVERLAIDLEQDCIALYWPTLDTDGFKDGTGGRLIGPKAAEWGDFDVNYFKKVVV